MFAKNFAIRLTRVKIYPHKVSEKPKNGKITVSIVATHKYG